MVCSSNVWDDDLKDEDVLHRSNPMDVTLPGAGSTAGDDLQRLAGAGNGLVTTQ